jgi:phage terminase large subunit-like protein
MTVDPRELRALLKGVPPERMKAVISSLPPSVAEQISKDWWFVARDAQLPPPGNWTYWTVLAGRGFGKTRTGTEWVKETARNNPGTVGHLVAPTAGDIERVMLYGPAGLITMAPDDFRPRYIGSKNKLIWPNGTVAFTFSAEEPERLRGPQCHWAWCDELAAWKRLMETWDQLQFGYRLVPTLGCVVTTTPRPLPVIKELVGKFKAQGFAVVTGGSTYDNKANLSEKFFREVVSKYEGTRLGRQELEAAILDDVPGALWTLTQIDGTRLPEATCDFERVVVAVDPPASSGEDADECGIVVAARGADKRGYVLADCSSHKETPQQWAARAVKAYHEYKADRIVAEANNGGEMVSAVILQVDPKVPVKLVHASRGKVTRAEPVSALYEQGRVSHVGTFAKLEDQMSAFTLDFDKKKMGYSPDRVDSLVWALTELMLGFIADNSIFAPVQVGAGPNNSLN